MIEDRGRHHRGRRSAPVFRTALSVLSVLIVAGAIGVAIYHADRRRALVATSPAAHQRPLSATGTTTAPTRPASPRPSPSPAATDPGAFAAAIQRYLNGSPARVSVLAVDDATHRSVSYQPDQRFQTASVVKVDILAALLLQADAAGRGLSSDERSLVDPMITRSDNDAASALWDEIGGQNGLAAADQRLGLTDTTPGAGDSWGSTATTVTDQVHLLDAVLNPAGPLGGTGAALVADEMGSVESDQAWGISTAVRTGETTVLKNGWMSPDDDSPWAINSIGRIGGPQGSITIAILTDAEPSESDGIATVNHLAQLARQYLG